MLQTLHADRSCTFEHGYEGSSNVSAYHAMLQSDYTVQMSNLCVAEGKTNLGAEQHGSVKIQLSG